MASPEYIVKLTAAVYGGDSLGRLPDGRAVFVPLALPGETVRLRLVAEKRGHARAEMVDIIEASPLRIAPACRHYESCGGCHYQHIPYAEQLRLKENICREQLQRIGGIESPPVDACVASPEQYHYRNHVQFHLTPTGKLGYYQRDGQAVFPLEECLLPQEPINGIWPQLDFESLTEIERIGLRLGADDDIQLILESADLQPPELLVEDLSISVAHVSPAGSLVLAGSQSVFIEVCGRPFRVSAGSFFQTNTAMAEALVTHLLNLVKLSPGMQVLDAYSGVGLFSAFLAGQVGRLVGIEASPSAGEDFEFNLDEFDNVSLYEAPVEEALPVLDQKFDLVLIDPPRSGIDRRAMDSLLALAAPQLVYISCDPATLARDAKRLVQGGYKLKKVTPFDLFPNTYHLESISLWEL